MSLPEKQVRDTRDSIVGCLLGTAVGDSLGLAYEGMTGERGGRMFPDRGRFHFLPGYGMVSDDTEHACFTAQALVKARGDPDRFERQLAWSLRWWLLGLPAGVGFATLRAGIRLWLGFPPSRSGVFSAGNGPSMRSPILGAAYGAECDKLREFTLRSTRITHTDPKAFHGALAVAVAAHMSLEETTIAPQEYLRLLNGYLDDGSAGEFLGLIDSACSSATRGEHVSTFAEAIGSRKGISGYAYHTVPCVIQVWLRHQQDYSGGITEIISAGGDTDTTAAILGGIIGAGVGKAGIPHDLLRRIVEWPRSTAWMERLGIALSRSLGQDGEVAVPGYFVPAIPLRNAVFLLTVLVHWVRRALPSYR
jgi:ADP-ribosylglycohydrolase